MLTNLSRGDRLLLLYSGGLESRYLLHLALELSYKPYCLLVDYGQKNKEELEYAVHCCLQLGIEWDKITLHWPVSSTLTDGSEEYDDVSPWYVPARNLILVSLAAGIAETKGIDTIWLGAIHDDKVNQFPDCTQDWLFTVNETLKKSLSKEVQVIMPLLGFTKDMVWALAENAGIKKEEIFSGYGE